MENRFFVMFSCCIPVVGYKRSIIYDLNRSSYSFIPCDMALILKKHSGESMSKLYDIYSPYKEILEEYFEFLEEKEFIFYTDERDRNLFPPLSEEWDYPGMISNAIIDTVAFPRHDIIGVINELCELGCEHIQIRQLDRYDNHEWLKNILFLLHDSTISSIDLYVPYISNDMIEELCSLIMDKLCIYNIFVYDSPVFSLSPIKNRVWGNLITIPQHLTDKAIQDASYFTVNVKLYTESLHFNNYLNRKIYIDDSGNIKNAPEQKIIFGKVSDSKLEIVVNSSGFQKLWHSKKDNIMTCRDCEFRYMCVDGRIPVKSNENTWHFTESCAYNPYIAKWRHEKGFINAEECGTFKAEAGFVPDDEKIKTLNKMIEEES